MTTRQPEALRLAEILEGGYSLAWLYERGGYEVSAELRTQHALIAELESQLEAIGAGGVSGPPIGQPQAMPDLSQLTERGAKAWAGVDAQGRPEGFTAADMATAESRGFRDGVASLSANAGEPRNAIDRDALIDAITQGLHGTWHCTRVWEAWHVGTMSQDDFEPVDESETPTEIADAVLALLATQPAAQALGCGAEPPGIQALMCVISSLRDIAHFSDEEGGELMSALCALRDWAYAQTVAAPQPSPTAQADSVQEDAARYRWLAASCRSTSEHWGGRWSIIIDGPAPKSHDSEDDFDAAVDAARKQGATQ